MFACVGPYVAPMVPSSVVSPAALPHAGATQPGGYIGMCGYTYVPVLHDLCMHIARRK